VLSAADMALKYDALLVPIFAERTATGLDFDVTVEAPIPHGSPLAMTQTFNDILADRVRARPDQWLWVHRRWKPERQTHQADAGAIASSQ
jgi:KDO2-lipid IV(A) lauroyltransferase